ncbi:MAG: hypothetical protein E6H98_09060 [Chloroflexi bacterium]|nr:MAG: hypothetical protein E6H98_09060 [Chloroflexota bacterium]
MSQAAPYTPAGPEQPVRRRGRTRLLLAPLGVVVVLLAVPGGAYAISQNQLSRAQAAEANSAYAEALRDYAAVESLAGNPAARVLLGELADRAQIGTAETHFLWGVQLRQQGKFAEGEKQLRAAVKSGFADWGARGNGALADLYYAWGKALVGENHFQAGIDKYKQVAAFDPTGNLAASTEAGLATAYADFAQWYTLQQPADYPNALIWYHNLVKDFPDSPEAKLAQASALPQTLYSAGLAFVQQLKYQEARDAMTELVQNYPKTSWATQAKTALAAKQPLTGRLIISDQNPTPVANRLKAHTYDDAGGPTYNATTDANGNFSVVNGIPPGQNYLITWWDPARKTFVTTFLSDNVPVNTISINPLEPAHTTVATS